MMSEAINILHLSDLHFDPKRKRDTEIVLESLFTRLTQIVKEKRIDLIVFSGDVVFDGSLPAYAQINEVLIHPLLSTCNLTRDYLLFCPGNHDIDRDVVRNEPWVEAGLLNTLKDRSHINDFIDKYWDTDPFKLPDALKRLTNYYKSTWNFENAHRVLNSPFLQAYKFVLSSLPVGVSCFNTAWRTTGEPHDADQGHLILGESAVDRAVAGLSDVSLRLAVFHHPLDWCVDADRASVEGRIQTEFDIVMCGHMHRASPEFRSTLSGDAVLSQSGCLYTSRDYFNGFTLISVQPRESNIVLQLEEYSDARRTFVPATRLVDSGVVSYPLPDKNRSSSTNISMILWKIKASVRKRANDHLSIAADSLSVQRDIELNFVCPPITSRWDAVVAGDGDNESQSERRYTTVEELLKRDKNLLIIGRPESGKTSVAHHIAVRCSNGGADRPRMPLMCRFSDVRTGPNALWRLVKDYASDVSDGTLSRALVEREPSLIIVDDVDIFDENRVALLQQVQKENPQARWILFAQTSPSMSPEATASAKVTGHDVHSIRELPRRAIRSLSAQWLATSAEADETDVLYQSVMDHIQRMGLPRSGYIVSLVLWALRNKSKGELLNESVLLQNIIDHMLGRMDYTGALRSEFDFTSKTAVLQELAYYFKRKDDILEKNDVVNFLIDFFKRKGLRYDAANIVEGFVNCGILYQLQENISFRYRRFQEFFVAGFLRDNNEQLKSAVKGDEWLNYVRELDLFSSRFRHEQWLLEVGLEKLKENALFDTDLSGDKLVEYMENGPQPDYTNMQLKKMRTERLTAHKIDDILDRAEDRLAKRRQSRKNEPAEAKIKRDQATIRSYRALELHSNLVRNLEFVDRDVKRDHLRTALFGWEKLLRSWMAVFRDVMDELRDAVPEIVGNSTTSIEDAAEGGGDDEESPEALVVRIIDLVESHAKTMMPTIVANSAFHELASEKLVDLIDDIIAEMPINSLSRMLFVFIMLEIDVGRAIDRLYSEKDKLEETRWMTAAISERLYAYYRSRPLASTTAPKFEKLVTDLELSLQGGTVKGGRRGRFMQALKKRAFREEPER